MPHRRRIPSEFLRYSLSLQPEPRVSYTPFRSPPQNTPLSHRDFTVGQHAPFTQGLHRSITRPFHTGTSLLHSTPAPFTQGLRCCTARPYHTGTSLLHSTPLSHRDALMTSSSILYVVNTISSNTVTPSSSFPERFMNRSLSSFLFSESLRVNLLNRQVYFILSLRPTT